MRLTIKQRNDELNETYIDGVSVDYLTTDLNASRVMNKLGQLEDIEEEIGIDLITLFKALMQVRLFYKDENGNINQCELSRLGFQLSPAFIFMYKGYDENNQLKCVACEPVWRYGKTWALTKEELE